MPDVRIEIIAHRPLGAYMTALVRTPQGHPKTVEAFMTGLANYLNAHMPLKGEEAKHPSPGLPTGLAANQVFQAVFRAGSDGTGVWDVAGQMAIHNVRRDAALECVTNAADRIVLRLPEPGNLAESEREAEAISMAGDNDPWPAVGYYYNYHLLPRSLTTMEYLWCNIGDYTMRSCRG
ncbi:MAG: hypothetical protein ACT4OK_16690 [Gemmobacter sp.]